MITYEAKEGLVLVRFSGGSSGSDPLRNRLAAIFFFVFFAPLAKESESVQEIQQQSKEIKEREREMKRKLLV